MAVLALHIPLIRLELEALDGQVFRSVAVAAILGDQFTAVLGAVAVVLHLLATQFTQSAEVLEQPIQAVSDNKFTQSAVDIK